MNDDGSRKCTSSPLDLDLEKLSSANQKKNSKMLGNSYGPFSTGVIVIDHRKLSLFWSARVLITPSHELLLEIDGCIQVVILFA